MDKAKRLSEKYIIAEFIEQLIIKSISLELWNKAKRQNVK